MNNLIIEIDNNLGKICSTETLFNEQLNTTIISYSKLYSKSLSSFSRAFNSLFEDNNKCNNCIEAVVIENIKLFNMAESIFNNDNFYTKTLGTEEFNKATVTTSLAKCSKDKRFYIMKCYDYFIYIFDRLNKKCYMLIKNNKKSLTMVNILLLTPYLMYGELFAIHGGLVNKDNNNILINNASLGGKTTMALLFASKGWNIITEETTYINAEGIILPYNIRNYFNIRLGTYLALENFFRNRGIINEEFLSLKDKTDEERFDYGKQSQFSIDFDALGTNLNNNNSKITHFLKVSINKNKNFSMKECDCFDNVKAFLDLSLAPTVLLFQDILNYKVVNKDMRINILKKICLNARCYTLDTSFDYIKYYDYIIEQLKKSS